jgi:hypothetical protein
MLLSEALGAPGFAPAYLGDDDWFPMLSHKGATALNSARARAMVGLPPDFLSKFMALSNSTRLSIKKAAHAVLSGAA